MTIRAGGAGGEPAPQQAGQQERREVVEREGVLEAIGSDVPAGLEPPGVVDQHVQPRVGAKYLSGQTAHLRLGGHVGGKGFRGAAAAARP